MNFETLCAGQFTLSIQLIKPKLSCHMFVSRSISNQLTIGSYVSVRSSRYDEARGKFGEHERCVRVAKRSCFHV